MKTVEILGTTYTYMEGDLNREELATNYGICELFDKKILIREREYMCGNTEEAKTQRFNHVLRHEIIHAVSQECGNQYGNDEALVDWIAHIIPIVNKVFEQIKESGE